MTRAALGVGIGLLLSERIGGQARRGAGWALVVAGVLSTIPLVVDVLRKAQSSEGTEASTNGRTGVRERPGTGVSASLNPQP